MNCDASNPHAHSLDTQVTLASITGTNSLDRLLRCEAVNQSKGATMGSADDEQHPETKHQQLSSDNTTSTHSNDAPRLTPMPRCLMHWWTPLAIAEGLLRWTLIVAIFWGGQPHWPSSEAMKLCVTIVGAGLAFSAWQQRSHDNAANAKQAQSAAEREDYWKRREQILRTLDSNNPRIRLAAVTLLAELADSTQHSKFLGDIEIQQLHQHIINTLRLQISHEGLNLTAEGTEQEHAEIQRVILDAILTRINCDSTNNSESADWSNVHIRLTETQFLTPIRIQNITTHATIDLSNSNLKHKLRIYDSKMGHIMWVNTNFEDGLEIGQHDKPVTIQIDEIPRNISGALFQNTTFITRKPILTIRPTPEWKKCPPWPTTEFRECIFLNKNCPCQSECDYHTHNIANGSNCQVATQCNCPTTYSESSIAITDIAYREQNRSSEYIFYKCQLNSVKLDLTHTEIGFTLEECWIRNSLKFIFNSKHQTTHNARYPHAHDYTSSQDTPNFSIQRNVFNAQQNEPPITISFKMPPTIRLPYIPINFDNNYIVKPEAFDEITQTRLAETPEKIHQLQCIQQNQGANYFHFEDADAKESKDRYIEPWDTGTYRAPILSASACTLPSQMQPTHIQQASDHDLELLRQNAATMRDVGDAIPLYTDALNNFADEQDAASSLKNGSCYIVTPVETTSNPISILGSFALSSNPAHHYEDTKLSWRSSRNFLVIRNIAPIYGRGTARAILDYASEHADYLRSDVNASNTLVRHALEVFGFKECGTFVAEDGSTRVAYDWIKEAAAHNSGDA